MPNYLACIQNGEWVVNWHQQGAWAELLAAPDLAWLMID